MSVHWSKEDAQGWVQIGLTRHVFSPAAEPDPDALCSPPPAVHADHSSCHECALAVERNAKFAEEVQRAGQAQVMSVGPGDCPPVGQFDPPSTVFSVPMSRREINRLIETLRRARDQSFGKDA